MSEIPAELPKTLFYFADPMCSWCWGFSPVMETIVRAFPDLPVSLIMGGLRAGNIQAMTPELREYILHHWQDVNHRTHQPFQFENALPVGFVYDTEPACRAVVCMIALQRRAAFAYLRTLQRAFYAQQQDTTNTDVLVSLSRDFDVEESAFRARFESEDMRARTLRHFAFAREVGVRGFPTIILGDSRGYRLLTSGYRTFDELRTEIEEWFTGTSTSIQ